MGHKRKHEPDVVLGSLLVSRPRDAVFAHPCAQRKRRLAEDDALAIGVDRPPWRSGKVPRSHEKRPVFPNEVVGNAVRKPRDHFPKRLGRRGRLGKGPFTSRRVSIERRKGGKGRLSPARLRVFQEKWRKRVAHESDGFEHLVSLFGHVEPPLILPVEYSTSSATGKAVAELASLGPYRLVKSV